MTVHTAVAADEPARPRMALTATTGATHGVNLTLDLTNLTASDCASTSAALLAHVASMPLAPAAVTLLDISGRFQSLGEAMSRHVAMVPRQPDQD